MIKCTNKSKNNIVIFKVHSSRNHYCVDLDQNVRKNTLGFAKYGVFVFGENIWRVRVDSKI